jgi:hypothetical protein
MFQRELYATMVCKTENICTLCREYKNTNIHIILHSRYDESADNYQIHFKLVWDSHLHLTILGEQKRVNLIWMPAQLRLTTDWKELDLNFH